MAKSRHSRSRRSQPQKPPMNRVDQPVHATSASLTKLLANSGAYPGSVVVLSGLARRETQQLYHRALGWWGQIYTIDAPPPGRVLWFSFFIPWQVWNWNCYGPSNNSPHSAARGLWHHLALGADRQPILFSRAATSIHDRFRTTRVLQLSATRRRGLRRVMDRAVANRHLDSGFQGKRSHAAAIAPCHERQWKPSFVVARHHV